MATANLDELEMAGERQKLSKARIGAIVLMVTMFIIAVSLLLDSQIAHGPQPEIVGFSWENHAGDYPRYVSVEGTILSSTPVAAKNVTLIVDIYVEGVSPHGWILCKTENIDLGSIPGNSSKHFSEKSSTTLANTTTSVRFAIICVRPASLGSLKPDTKWQKCYTSARFVASRGLEQLEVSCQD